MTVDTNSEMSENLIYSRMTEDELKFARQYRNDIAEVFKKLALDYMPGPVKEFAPLTTPNESFNTSSITKTRKIDPPVPQPNMNSTVFVKAVEDVTGVIIEDEAGRGGDESYDMAAGSQHIMSYKSISNLIRSGSVKLI